MTKEKLMIDVCDLERRIEASAPSDAFEDWCWIMGDDYVSDLTDEKELKLIKKKALKIIKKYKIA